MSKQREALKLALKALQRGRPQIVGVLVQQDQDNAIQAILEALADPVQEAAPDLLEALEHMLHRAHPAYVGNDYMREKLIAARETARAAIAKAKGEL